MEIIKNVILKGGMINVKTNDYDTITQSILSIIDDINKSNDDFEIEKLIFSQGIETFESIKSDKDTIVEKIRSTNYICIILRNMNLFDDDEIIHICEKYIKKKNKKISIIIIDPLLEISNRLKPYIIEYKKYYKRNGLTPFQEHYQNDIIIEHYKKQELENNPALKILSKPKFKSIGLDSIRHMIESIISSNQGKGVLLLGVPGTGKSLFASQFTYNHLVLQFNIGRLFNKYLGNTEENLEQCISIVENNTPCIVMIDEFEKFFSNNSHEVSQRVLGKILNWLQNKPSNVYIIATLNGITSLPLELIRPGRWDMVLSLTPPPESIRLKIMEYYKNLYKINDKEFNQLINTYNIDNITPADIENIFRLTSIIGYKNAKKYIKLTKDITDNFQEVINISSRYGSMVYNEDDNDII